MAENRRINLAISGAETEHVDPGPLMKPLDNMLDDLWTGLLDEPDQLTMSVLGSLTESQPIPRATFASKVLTDVTKPSAIDEGMPF
jgi:hypothetical protein